MRSRSIEIVLALLVAVIAFGSGAYWSQRVASAVSIDAFGLLCLLAVSGAFGGFLHYIRDGVIRPDGKDGDQRQVFLLRDLLFGMAGGILMLVALPGTPTLANPWEAVKLIGLAIALGYAGQSVVSSVAAGQIKRIEEKQTALLEADKQKRKDAALEAAVAEIRRARGGPLPGQSEALVKAFEEASPDAVHQIWNQMEEVRWKTWREAWRAKPLGQTFGAPEANHKRAFDDLKSATMVLDALVQGRSVAPDHRYLGSAGFAKGNIGEYDQSIDLLNRADQTAGQGLEQSKPWYALGRAVARLERAKLASPTVSLKKATPEVQKDLDAAKAAPEIASLLDKLTTTTTTDEYQCCLSEYLKP